MSRHYQGHMMGHMMGHYFESGFITYLSCNNFKIKKFQHKRLL